MSKNRAFSLVELSIVLVIVGLIVAAIILGAALVNQAKLKHFINESKDIRFIITTFINKYNSFPGDMNNAFDYWGTSCASTSDKCNGNGDGFVELFANDAENNEAFRSWQHMALAGISPYSYTTGLGTGGLGNTVDIGYNVPQSRIKNVGFMYIDHVSTAKPYLNIGTEVVGTDYLPGSAFSPFDAYHIDTKVDDGVSNSGLLAGADGSGEVAGSCASAGAYEIQTKTPKCYFDYFFK